MFTTIFFQPLYNALVWLVAHMPEFSIALAVIVLTILVKLVLAPLSFQALKSQLIQKELQPHMARIKKEYPDKKEQGQKMMELYQRFKTNPFSGCLVLIIQLPIIWALYRIFLTGLGDHTTLLYTGLHIPQTINTMFLGMDMTQKSMILAIVAAAAQFAQIWFSPSRTMGYQEKKNDQEKTGGLAEQFGAGMQKQMLFMMPLMMLIIGRVVPAAAMLYLIVTAVFTLAQEFLARPRLARILASYYSEGQ